MNHVGLAFIAMVSYGATAVLLRLSMRTMPPEVALVITNEVLMVAAVGWMVVRAVNIPANLSLNVSTTAMFVAGATLSVIAYYMALAKGPVSVVGPIFGLGMAVAAVLGILALGEPLKVTRVLGVVLAAGAGGPSAPGER